MAKEGKSVSKGFGFYLVVILLVVVFAFIAVVCAMIIMPRTNILGYQYFSERLGDKEILGIPTGQIDDNGDHIITPFDFENLKTIKVSCGSSDVVIMSSDKNAIKFSADISGFAKSSAAVEYKYDDYSYSGGVLTINVTEPKDFLRISNSSTIEICIAKGKNTITPDVEITTSSGNVQLGANDGETTGVNVFANSCEITTDSGNVILTDRSSVRNLKVTTKSGSFRSYNNMLLLNECNLATQRGTFIFNSINHLGGNFTVNASMGSGALNFETIYADLKISGENFKLSGNTITGSLDASSHTIKKAAVSVVNVNGDVSIPYAKESSISINKIGGQTYIETTSGNVKIGGEVVKKDENGQDRVLLARENSGICDQSYIASTSGQIDVIVNDASANTHYFESTSGKISVEYASSVKSKNYIASETGNVSVMIYSDYLLEFAFRNKNSVLYESLGSKLDISLILQGAFVNPLKLNGYTGNANLVDISTDGVISCGLLKYKNN